MSNQERGEKLPPEQHRGEAHEIHGDLRVLPRPEFVAPQIPPAGSSPPGYPPPQREGTGPAGAPRRRRGLELSGLIALIIVLFLCAGGALVGTLLGFGFGVGRVLRNSATEPARTFPVSTRPALMLTSEAGSVTVTTKGSTKGIAVQATKYASFGGNLNAIQITYSQRGNTLNVAVHRSGRSAFFDSTSVDFMITVPPTTDLQIMTHAGDITVNGVSGKMSLRSLAGSIGATRASLTASSTFKTNAGGITFNGSLGTTGTYDFETNAGSIEMTLPGASSFQMNAAADVGTITTSFPVSVRRSVVGSTANGKVGIAPQAILTLRTNAGSINLERSSQVSFSALHQESGATP